MLSFSNGYYNKDNKNPLERHMTNGWEGLMSSLPASLGNRRNLLSMALEGCHEAELGNVGEML